MLSSVVSESVWCRLWEDEHDDKAIVGKIEQYMLIGQICTILGKDGNKVQDEVEQENNLRQIEVCSVHLSPELCPSLSDDDSELDI